MSIVADDLCRQRVLVSHITVSSILNLNSVLLQSPESLTQSYQRETSTVICQGIGSKNVCPAFTGQVIVILIEPSL